MSGMVTNTSASLATSITIWDLVMSGWFVTRSGSNVFMDGKEVILIGGHTPFAMIVTETTAMGIITPGVTLDID